MRTGMAGERTLMAWVRTALAMFSFGFTIYKVLQGVQDVAHVHNLRPRNAGLLLVGMGVLSLMAGTFEYWATQRALGYSASRRLRSPTLILAFAMFVGGAVLFFTILTRMA
jgi:putative membrane protein